ncbi:hypothetical protein I4U23_029795 [Adineta vaga]|nr:hypothetical protein I4U23_029795 [Adineta vaga]
MNSISRVIWLLVNLFFGAPLSTTLFVWVACDLQMPLLITNFISTYLPICNVLFDVPYVYINQFSSSVTAKLLFNACLFAIFGFVHTLFAQEFIQVILSRYLFPKQTLRTIFCILVSITTFILIGFWQHTHIQLWNWLPSTMNMYEQQRVLLILFSIIISPGLYVLMKFNIINFCGIKQLFDMSENNRCPYSSSIKIEERTTGNQTLVTSGLFRLCRHPLYLFTILAWAITPTMSLDRLALLIYTCLYLLIGIPVEERKLIGIFGNAYINYQRHIPAILPFFIKKIKQI